MKRLVILAFVITLSACNQAQSEPPIDEAVAVECGPEVTESESAAVCDDQELKEE